MSQIKNAYRSWRVIPEVMEFLIHLKLCLKIWGAGIVRLLLFSSKKWILQKVQVIQEAHIIFGKRHALLLFLIF